VISKYNPNFFKYEPKEHTLVENLKVLESQLDVVNEVLTQPEFDHLLTGRLKFLAGVPLKLENQQEEQIKLLTTEKERLENYLKIYNQRINSLSKIILFYQNQFKLFMEQVKNTGRVLNYCLAVHVSPNQNPTPNTVENEEDNDSFDQYELESAVNSAAPVSLTSPIVEKPQSLISHQIKIKDKKQLENENLQEIITLKNILIQAQQEEIGRSN
jgi:hypothetical protein